MGEKRPNLNSRRSLSRYLAQVVEPVSAGMSGERLAGPRLGWRFAPRTGCSVGLWAQVESWGRAFRLEGSNQRLAIRFEVGVGSPGPDMYEEASLVHGTTTLMEALDSDARDGLAKAAWRVIRGAAGEGAVNEAIEDLGLAFRVEQGDAFFPVLTESDVLTLVSVLEKNLPRMIHREAGM